MTRQTVESSSAVGHESAHDTIVPHGLPSLGSGSQPTKAKVCSICGVNVAGQRRYKDGAGRYFCEDCYSAETDDTSDAESSIVAPPPPAPTRKTTVSCPDCKTEIEADSLVDYKGMQLCSKCIEKREQSARRESARIAAAEEEAFRQEQQKKLWIRIGMVVLGLLALYGIIRFVME
jgi:hypothetical protein